MQATRILSEEHQLILRALAVARRMADRLRAGGEVRRAEVADLVDFLRGFADRHHHAKEEEVLFPWMEARGFSRSYGPLACMLGEHESGRQLVREIEARGKTLPAEPGLCAAAIETFATHLEHHIAKEDQILFPMADRLGDGDAEILPRYASAIPDAPLAARKYHAMVEDLERSYPGVDPECSACGCGGRAGRGAIP